MESFAKNGTPTMKLLSSLTAASTLNAHVSGPTGVGDENVVFVDDVVRQEHALVERLKL